MSDDQPSELNRRRTRRAGTSDRAEALARLQSLRRRSSGDGPAAKSIQVKIDQPIYDTVDDDEYEAIVAKRREEAKGFIVDDNGLGYGDEGQEEDWTHPTAYSSSEGESNDESERKAKKKKGSNNSEKKDRDASAKKSASLTSAAALMGKQRISNMFTSSVFNKKDNGKNVSYDSIVDDVIAEFAPDESDRERRRRVLCPKSNRSNISLNSVSNFPVKIERTSVVGSIGLNGTDDINSNGGGNYEQLNNEGLVEKEENFLTDEKDLCDLIKNEIIKENGEEIKEENKERSLKTVNQKDEVTVMEVEKKVFAFNAKITEVKDRAFSANLEWQAVKNGGLIVDGDCNRPAPKVDVKTSIGEGSKDFELESDGSLPFYILDAHEEAYGANSGNLYLFGKVKSGGTYESCCVVVKNMQRCVHAIPTVSLMDDVKVMELEKVLAESRDSVKESQVALRARLHELMSDLKTEITEELLARNVSSFCMAPVKRHYAFERSDIPHGENYVLKINYPFKDSALPSDLKGNKFCALLRTNSSALELFLIKRKIMGPSWLSISRFSRCQSQNVSWCKFEITVDSPKDIMNSPSSMSTSKIPPVVVAALSLKTVINEKQNSNEIVSASVICCNKAKIDTPMVGSEWTRPGMLSHFTVLRKLEGGIFPMGFTKEAAEKNSCAGSNIICHESSERALLNRLMIELHKLDSDVLVGHNISGFDLDVLLHRAQACKVQSNMWSKIGRLRRSTMPKLNRGSSVFGLGASFGVMSCIAGRLLCDTHICSRDLLKEVSYSLTHLAKTQLNKDRREITPQDIPQMFQSSQSLMELIEYGETDAWLSMELMFHLSVLPLTHQLTKISGNIWQKTLQGARAQRVEYLLLHKFNAKKFILPDKYSSQSKDSKTTKRTINPDYANFDDEPPENDQAKTKKGPSYSGGLVLEPKKGLYDKYVLLLDFNSLYPSIIQEYNICFTTVERPADGSLPRLPSSQKTGVLPELLRSLVERRRKVKSLLKKESGLKGQQLDILQQALKLTANSMYGCLGFSNSRFYAKPLAELITQQGREILQSTVNLVQNTLNLEVIYGDTDSIMIYSGLDDIGKARSIAEKVIHEVNKKYSCLEIDLDGLYKRMLLLKKKKYAAVKLLFRDGTPYEVIERKGLDMVRRDWSLLSKELGDFCLTQILSGGSCEDVVEVIHNKLRKVQEEMRNGQITLEKYVITKTLTKPPEAYPDARNQPHVEVALRLKRNGYVTGCSAGDTVPYIICCEQGNSSTSSSGIAQRARHPDELKTDNANWIIDIDYYLAQQIHPVISRLCASIQGTSPSHLADCLGLDSSKFQNKSTDSTSNDPSNSLIFTLDDEERYRGCEPLVLSCPSCSSNFQCSPILNSVCELIDAKQAAQERPELTSNFWQKLRCPKCPDEDGFGRISPAVISNQVKRQADAFIARYYKALMVCDDETCNYTTRSVSLRVLGDSERGTVCPNYPHCNGHLIRKYTEADLYRQLSYFCHTLDTVRCIEKVEGDKRFSLEKELAKIRPLVENASSVVQKIRDRCAYGWVKLNDLIVMV